MKKRDKKHTPQPVAHFIARRDVTTARAGTMVKAACGLDVTGIPPEGAPMCQACVMAQLAKDDTTADERLVEQHRAGVQQGEQRATATARANAMRELREAAERHAVEKLNATPVARPQRWQRTITYETDRPSVAETWARETGTTETASTAGHPSTRTFGAVTEVPTTNQ